jgi:hypothetical protein
MRIRIALGATLGLAAAFAFVWLQFRAEAIAQDVSPIDPKIAQDVSPEEPAAESPEAFGSIQVFSGSEAESIPLPESIGNVAVFAEDAKTATAKSEPADPFADDAPPARTSNPFPPGVESVDSDSESYDPFSSAGAKLQSEPSGLVDAFASDSETESADFGSSMKEQPIRIIRLRTVRAAEVGSIIESLFHEEADRRHWFLSMEDQSNSLIFKGPARDFDQFKKLANELDRLAETPVDPRKKTQSWPVPHAFDDSPETPSRARAAEWPIRIIRLRHLKAENFTGIAWNLAESQNSETQLRIFYEAATNSVVVRGPAAEISQVEQLAQQIDQPAIGAGGGEFADSTFDLIDDSGNRDVLVATGNLDWQDFDGPAVQTQRMREYVAHHDQESVRLASEIRSLRRQHSSNHPKLAEARQKLEDILEASFKLRLQLQGLEVAAIKSKLADIESRVQRRSQLRQQIINRRLRELLGEKDDLSWEVARSGPVQPNRWTGDHLPPPDSFVDESTADFVDLVPESDAVEEDLVPPTPYAGEIRKVVTDAGTRVPAQPVAELSPGVESESETASSNIRKPVIDDDFEIVGREVPAETPVTSRPQNGLNDSSRNEDATWQLELIVAEHAVEVSSLKVDRIKSRLSKSMESDQEEDLKYELQLAMLESDQAKRLLEQKRRWIGVQRKSLEVNIRYLEKSVALARSEYELMIETLKNVPGSVPVSEVRRQELEIQKAELRLEQAESDLDVFEVENRTSRTSGTTRSTPGVPAAKNKPAEAEPRFGPGTGASRDLINKGTPIEPGITLPEANLPTPSAKPLTPVETPSSSDKPLPGPSS